MAISKKLIGWVFAALLISASLLILAGRANAETLGFSLSDSRGSEFKVTVLDDSTLAPITDAQVTVTDSLDGSTRLPGRTITVSRDGYGTLTLAGVQANQVTAYLKPFHPSVKDLVASGTLGGWQPSATDNVVQAGLVFRNLSAMDLLAFNTASFVSPLYDTIDVFGSHKIPSNLVLPEQDVFLAIGSITLNKPMYRLPLPPGKATRLAGVEGEISVSDITPAFSGGGASIDLLNKARFTRVGLTSVMSPDQDFQKDFDAVIELAEGKHTVTVDKPPFVSHVLVTALTDLSGDRQTLIPTDIKVAINGNKPDEVRTVSLSAPSESLGRARDVAALAVSDRGAQVSGIITDSAGKDVHPGPFLDAPKMPQFKSLPDAIALQAPAKGVSAAVFEQAGQAAWTVYVFPSAGSVSVPTSRLATRAQIESYAVVTLEFDSGFSERTIDGSAVMRKLERFARSQASQKKDMGP